MTPAKAPTVWRGPLQNKDVRAAIGRDLRYALRVFAASPGFSSIAILTLAIGIGANTSIFTVANALLLRPLPYSNPERLALVSLANPTQGTAIDVFSYPRFTFIRDHSTSFSGIAAFAEESFNLTESGDPEQLPAARVSANFFRVLGVPLALGRDFLPQEDTPSGKPVVVISHGLWMRRFAGNAAVLGRPISLNTMSYTIVGVAPAGFHFGLLTTDVDVWAPRVFDLNLATPQQIQAGAGFLNAVARLRTAVSMDQAQAEMNVLNRQYQREFAALGDANPKNTVVLGDLQQQLVSNIRPAVLILFSAVFLVLLIACANVASLLLSRSLARKKEIAVRVALGATRADLIRQLLTEGILMSCAGGILGISLGAWATPALATMAGQSLPRIRELRTDGFVLVFGLVVSILTGIVFGLIPALQASRADISSGLREEGRGATGGRRRNSLRVALVLVQVALSVILLIGSGLLIRSFVHLLQVSPGFDPENILTMNIPLPPSRYSGNHQMVAFCEQVVEQARRIPGVRSAAAASALPLNPTRFSPALLEGQPAVPMPQRPMMVLEMVSPTYFQAMGTQLLSGRVFMEHDDEKSPLVAVVNQALVRRFWPKQNPIGKRIYLGRLTTPMEVVGVTSDIRNVAITSEASPEIYMPFAQRPWRSIDLILRTSSDPHTFIATARHVVATVDKQQPITAVRTMDEVLAASRTQPRLIMFLLGVFSGTALLLALVGIYGMLSYLVEQRTQELGIRMALGASRADILAMVIRQGMTITLGGVVVGTALSLLLTRLLAGLLFQVSGTDPATYVMSAAVFGIVALLASYVPARRATRVNPMLAMR